MNETGFLFIPEHIMELENLTLKEKCIYGRILGLTKKEGYCYATNEWIGKQLGISGSRVSKYISGLAKKGYLQVRIIKNTREMLGGVTQGIERHIYVYLPSEIIGATIPIVKNAYPPIVKNDYPYIYKNTDKKVLDKNIVNTEYIDNTMHNVLSNHIINRGGVIKNDYPPLSSSPSGKNTKHEIPTAKNSLVRMTNEEVYNMAERLGVTIESVFEMEIVVLRRKQEGYFNRKKHKTTYWTVLNWLQRKKDDGKADTWDDFYSITFKGRSPDSDPDYYDRWQKRLEKECIE